jgi:hypothetical protein
LARFTRRGRTYPNRQHSKPCIIERKVSRFKCLIIEFSSFQMGSVFSLLVGPPPQEESRPTAKYIVSPIEASTAPEDTEKWYCDFFGHIFAAPHKDGEHIIIYEPKEPYTPNYRARPEWPSRRLQKAYELLGEGHPRIVRYVQRQTVTVSSLT